MNRYHFFGQLAMLTSMAALLVDIMLEYMGIKARTSSREWLTIYTGISVVTHVAILMSPLFRHATDGKRWLWCVSALPILLIFSLITTLVSQSSFIQGQANKIEQARSIQNARFALSERYQNAADIQHRYDFAQRSLPSLDKARELLMAEPDNQTSSVTSTEAITIPLEIINAILPSPISAQTFLTIYYTMMSFGLVLIGYFFSELSLEMFKKADETRTNKKYRDISRIGEGGQNPDKIKALTDEDSITAIDAKLASTPHWIESDINREWIKDAHFHAFGKARRDKILDDFIEPTRLKLKPWYKKIV